MSILQMSLAASRIILFAALLRKLAHDRLPKRTFLALWLLAAARMLLPWKLSFRYSATAIVHRAAEPAIRSATPAAIRYISAPAVAQAAPVSVWRIVWLAGLIGCALMLTLPHLRWRRVYARSLPCADEKVEAWLQSQKLLRRVCVRVSDEIPSPLTCGLLRPVILLPARLNRCDGVECVLAHELAHIRHLDALWKPVLAAALCAHWFNPLAWIMYLLANRDIELACDEAALRCLGDPARRDYARTLIDLAAQQSGLPSPLLSGFSRNTIEERIRAIMKMKKLTKIAALAAALLVAFSALAFATTAETIQDGSIRPEIEELMFDGYEEMSILEYQAWLIEHGIRDASQIINENLRANERYADFVEYVLEPLCASRLENGLIYVEGHPALASDPNDVAMNFRVGIAAANLERLTVGMLRDSYKGVLEGMRSYDYHAHTQEELQAYAVQLETQYSNEAIHLQVQAELAQWDSPYADPEALTLLEAYAALGLEYDYTLGELTMRFEGREVNGIWDDVTGSIIANSTGPKGLGGGSILEVIYEDGAPAGLRFIEP